MPVAPSAVSSLRTRTGVSILACKDALEEAQGDEEKAIEILRKRGIAQAAKKSARDQSEGLVFLAEAPGKAALLMLKCETDFVARADAFQALGTEFARTLLENGAAAMQAVAAQKIPDAVQKLGENIAIGENHCVEAPILGCYVHSNRKIGVAIGLQGGTRELARDVAMHAAAFNPQVVSPDDVPAALVEKEQDIWRAQLKKENKPEAIWDKIMLGKERKFREENALLKQAFAKDPSKTVEQVLAGAKVIHYIRLSVV